jgi:hypothetical protein
MFILVFDELTASKCEWLMKNHWSLRKFLKSSAAPLMIFAYQTMSKKETKIW